MEDIITNFNEMSVNRPWMDWEWLVKIRNPFDETGHYFLEPTFLGCEIEYVLLAFLTYLHARHHGSENLWIWRTTIGHGLFVELVSYFAEPIDNFWHAQGTLQLFGQREPIHIILLYPAFIYPAWIAVEKLGLKGFSRCAGVALFTLINDLPYDIMGAKLLWWIWHDTDRNILDRHFWVPWGSYYFHLTFAFSFTWIYTTAKKRFSGQFWPTFLTSVLSMPLGCLQFTPLFHIGKDVFGIHQSITTGILVAIYLFVFVQGLLTALPPVEDTTKEVGASSKRWNEVVIAEIIHFSHYFLLVLFADPKSLQVLGLHQPMGSQGGSGDKFDCLQTRNLTYPYPLTQDALFDELKGPYDSVTVWKRPFICENGEHLDEAYYDFSCEEALKQKWVPGNTWYWICGTDWNDGSGLTKPDYVLVVSAACLLGLSVYFWALCLPHSPKKYFQSLSFPTYVPKTIRVEEVEAETPQKWETEKGSSSESSTPEKQKSTKTAKVSKTREISRTTSVSSTQSRYNLRKRKPRSFDH